MRRLILKWGLRRSLVFTVLLVTLLSNLLNALIMLPITGEVPLIDIVIATVVPVLLSGTLGYLLLSMVFELDAARNQLRQLSITDELTQSYNRRYFLNCLERELESARRSGTCFSVILFDLDDFKHVNDQYGHAAGDMVLSGLAQYCRQKSRASDIFARYGGEEFAFLLPEASFSSARRFAERIRTGLEKTRWEYESQKISVTASFGVVTWEEGIDDLETILVKADNALYNAKLAGKNCVVAY